MSKTKAILVRIPAEDHAVLSSMSKAIGRSVTAQTRYMLMAVAASKGVAAVTPQQQNLIGSEAWLRSEERKAWDQFMSAGIMAGHSCVTSAHFADQALKLRKDTFK